MAFEADRSTHSFRETWQIKHTKDTGKILSKLTLYYNDSNDTIELLFKNEDLKSFLSSSIPQSNRTWFSKKSCWVIVPDSLPDVVAFSRHLFNHIESSSLPINYQKIIQDVLQDNYKKGKNVIKNEVKFTSKYSELYLLDSAPDFIVKAAYKALAKHYHPDGDAPNADKFKTIKDAYENIVKS